MKTYKLATLTLLVIPFLSVGCASTEVWQNGQRVFRTEMNCRYMALNTSPSRSSLIVHGMNHSTPTRAGGSVLGTGLGGVTGVAGALIIPR